VDNNRKRSSTGPSLKSSIRTSDNVSTNSSIDDGFSPLILGSRPLSSIVTTYGGVLGDAIFEEPHGVLFNPRDNCLYVSDMSAVKKAHAPGTVTTFRPHGSSYFFGGTSPIFRMALYDAGNVFFAAAFDNRQIKCLSSEGKGIVLAGSGKASIIDGQGNSSSFRRPFGITIDRRTGDLFVTDGHAVRKITQQGLVTTIAGSGKSGLLDGPARNARFCQPRGLAFHHDGGGGCLYIADSGNNRIRKLELGTEIVSTVAGCREGYLDGIGTVARFKAPQDVAILGLDGSLIVADYNNHRIRRIQFIDGRALVDTLAGTGTRGCTDGPAEQALFNYPFSVCVDNNTSTCYIADMGNNKIRKMNLQ